MIVRKAQMTMLLIRDHEPKTRHADSSTDIADPCHRLAKKLGQNCELQNKKNRVFVVRNTVFIPENIRSNCRNADRDLETPTFGSRDQDRKICKYPTTTILEQRNHAERILKRDVSEPDRVTKKNPLGWYQCLYIYSFLKKEEKSLRNRWRDSYVRISGHTVFRAMLGNKNY